MTQHNFVTNDFAELTRLVGNQVRKVAHNTTIKYNGGLECFEVVYHWSVVVRVWRDNSISLYSNGYRTVLTKERLNWYAQLFGWKVYQEKFSWFAIRHNTGYIHSDILSFHDNLHIGCDGELIEEEQEQAWQDAKYRMP